MANKAVVIGIEGKKVKEINLPSSFKAKIREDIIHKVFEATKKQQPYATYKLAGKEVSASGKQSHRRRKYKTLYGSGVSRIPRKILTRRGERFYWQGAFISGTVGGMAAHPPKGKRKKLKINKKEKRIAIKGAIAATTSKKILEKKYPKLKITCKLPVILESSVLEQKTKDIIRLISKIFGIKIGPVKKVRAGKGKRRGRKYKKIKRVLFVTSTKENVKKLKNFGIDIAQVSQLNISILASGGTPGKIVVWTEKAIEDLK